MFWTSPTTQASPAKPSGVPGKLTPGTFLKWMPSHGIDTFTKGGPKRPAAWPVLQLERKYENYDYDYEITKKESKN